MIKDRTREKKVKGGMVRRSIRHWEDYAKAIPYDEKEEQELEEQWYEWVENLNFSG